MTSYIQPVKGSCGHDSSLAGSLYYSTLGVTIAQQVSLWGYVSKIVSIQLSKLRDYIYMYCTNMHVLY